MSSFDDIYEKSYNIQLLSCTVTLVQTQMQLAHKLD